jgi:hypothetical protein
MENFKTTLHVMDTYYAKFSIITKTKCQYIFQDPNRNAWSGIYKKSDPDADPDPNQIGLDPLTAFQG